MEKIETAAELREAMCGECKRLGFDYQCDTAPNKNCFVMKLIDEFEAGVRERLIDVKGHHEKCPCTNCHHNAILRRVLEGENPSLEKKRSRKKEEDFSEQVPPPDCIPNKHDVGGFEG